MSKRHTITEYRIESQYEGEWSTECYAEDFRDALRLVREYRENDPSTPHRIERKRVPNPSLPVLYARKRITWDFSDRVHPIPVHFVELNTSRDFQGENRIISGLPQPTKARKTIVFGGTRYGIEWL